MISFLFISVIGAIAVYIYEILYVLKSIESEKTKFSMLLSSLVLYFKFQSDNNPFSHNTTIYSKHFVIKIEIIFPLCTSLQY